MADKSEQTEKATQRRVLKAREDGNFPIARDFVNALQFLLFVMLMGSGGAAWFAQCRFTMRTLLERSFHEELTAVSLVSMFWWSSARLLLPLAWLGAALLLLTVAVQLASTGFGLSLKKLAPDFNRINPATKLSGLMKQNIPAFVQALIMIPTFGFAVYRIAQDRLDTFFTLPMQGLDSGTSFVAKTFSNLLYRGAFAFFIFGAVNFVRQRRQYATELKMSKQEIKEESKESNGNPHTKQRVRRLQRDMRRRQMMREVPTATAVIVNPTHYAVAIKYSIDSMSAPLVVAKGKNYLALRIRTLATSHQVPIIENPPLARALYESADVGQEIPGHLYRAVAEILAYIYKLMNGKLPG